MIDVIIGAFLTVMLLGGLASGLMRQLWSTLALLASTWLAGSVYYNVVPFATEVIPHQAGARLASFSVAFLFFNLLLNAPAEMVIRRIFGPKDHDHAGSGRVAGALLGLIQGVFLVEAAASAVLAFPVLGWDRWLNESLVLRLLVAQWPLATSVLPPELGTALFFFR